MTFLISYRFLESSDQRIITESYKGRRKQMKEFEMEIHNKKIVARSEETLYSQMNTLFMILKSVDESKL